MLSTKSIDKMITLSIVLSVLSIIFIILLKNKIEIDTKYLVFVLLVSNLFICLLIIFKDNIKFLLSYLFTTLIFYLLFFLVFRSIRDFFPVQNIKGSEVVGFYNYFEYPVLFDLFFFIVVLSAPILLFFLIKKLNDK